MARVIPASEVRQLMAKLPAGTDTGVVVQKLRDRGHTVDGFGGPADSQVAPPTMVNTDPLNIQGQMNRLATALPGVGGFVGGFGGPVGAAIGGGIGEAGRQAMTGAPTDVGRMGLEGGKEAALTMVGGQLGKAAAPAAKGIMRYALRLSKGVQKNFGDIAGAALKTKTPVGKKSAENAAAAASKAQSDIKGAWSTAVADVQRLLTAADDAGATISVQKIAMPMVKAAEKAAAARGVPLQAAELDQIMEMVTNEANDILNRSNYGVPIRPTRASFKTSEAHLIKQGAADDSRAFYTARARGERVRPERSTDIAAGARAALEEAVPGMREAEGRVGGLIELQRAARRGRSTGNFVNRTGEPLGDMGDPFVDDLTDRARESIGLERALADAQTRTGGVALPTLVGGTTFAGSQDPLASLVTALLARGIMDPRTLSRGAIGLNSSAARSSLRQTPRLVDLLVDQLRYQEPTEDDGEQF